MVEHVVGADVEVVDVAVAVIADVLSAGVTVGEVGVTGTSISEWS